MKTQNKNKHSLPGHHTGTLKMSPLPPRQIMAGMNISQMVSVAGFIIGFVTIWIHLEIRIAEINVDLTNLKQDMYLHKTDNRKDIELLRNETNNNIREILVKVDEIQIYLRNRK